ncbi:hypothetical protein SAMN05216282_1373 [Cryobacterium psychrotolerans]|uniref:DUF7882 domain-containing protein n=1 Tax=Cryobacterium psychrotolerans TaxID=386301 RepID=A0A1G9HSA4_9MICO|nr:ATP-dependent DNA ligase [Cryobacterium sp. TMT1-2-1]TFD88657.1 ATP-dependent DNA ligase [Cryobacterium psychrotolerans]SDL15887.1 hypothetical protein SAMN05216282_1373 [Cryobacterium psychrotolerans]
MGHFLFGSPPESVRIDDRVLAHLKVVMLTKLRRHEGFAFTFEFEPTSGSGRSTVWLNATVLIQFRFEGSRVPVINRIWLDALMQTANDIDGLRIVPEPTEPSEPSPHTASIPVQRD